MSDISRWLGTFVLNALWQITAICLLIFLCAGFVPIGSD